MIISGGARSNGRWFAKHLTNAEDNERVTLLAVHGLMTDNVPEAFREMGAMARGSGAKNWFYHADINPREYEHLTDEQGLASEARLARNLGLEDQPGFVIKHEKNGRVHYHMVRYRVDDDGRVISDSFSAQTHERTSRELEEEFGLEPVESVLVTDRETPRPERRPKNWEVFRGNSTGIDPQDVKREVTALWERSDTGPAFAHALEEAGYILCQGDRRDFCIVDREGDEHSLGRRIAGVKAADVRARMSGIERDSLPSVQEGRELARRHLDDADAATAKETPARSGIISRKDAGENASRARF